MRGCVVRGRQLARTMGFPTANIVPEHSPREGVYYGQTALRGAVYHCVVSVGKSPSIAGKTFCVEVHLFGWSGAEFYGEEIRVAPMTFLRGMRKVAGVTDLKNMVQNDIKTVVEHIIPTTPLLPLSSFD